MQKQIRDGLILRSLSEGYARDQARLPAFYADIFVEAGVPEDESVGPWSEDLISGDHPTIRLDDIWVVVDPEQDDRIASALLLVPQTWRYAGIDIPTGRIELVATHKDYRRRGLIRELIKTAHQRSKKLGHQLQVINGIPNYYRQFGYATAIDIGSDSALPVFNIPKRDKKQKVQYTLRPATEGDIPDLVRWYDAYAATRLLSVVRRPERWHYEMVERQPGTAVTANYLIIMHQEMGAVGYVALGDVIWGNCLYVNEYVVGEKSSYLATYEDVLRGIRQFARQHFPADKQPEILTFENGIHPTLKTLIAQTFPGRTGGRTSAWYLRTPDLPGFLMRIAPVLEQRLQGSGANNFTGKIGVNFYDKTGLLMTFEQGRLIKASGLTSRYKPDAAFPWQMFLALVFGYRGIDELHHILPEVQVNRQAAIVLDALFPRKPSWIMGVM